MVRDASPAARALARKKLVDAARPNHWPSTPRPVRAPHTLNPAQRRRFRADRRRHSGARIPHVPVARRHRIRQDRGLPQRHRRGARMRPQRAAAGARRSRLTPAVAGQFFTRVRRPRGHSAQRVQRFRARRSVAPHPRGRGGGGGGHALRRLRARAQSGPDRGRRRARPELQAGRNAALQRPRCGHRARAGGRRVRGAGFGHAQSRKPLQRRARQVHAAGTARTASRRGPCRRWS